jgi:uncharacterized membrane protein (DUF485 family)
MSDDMASERGRAPVARGSERADDKVRDLVRRRWRVGLALTAVMVVAYFGFILLVAFDKDDAGALILDDRVSVGIVLGALVIVLAPVLTAIYVRWANRHYDPHLPALPKATATKDGAS